VTAALVRCVPWENGYVESFNARLRDELLDGEIFYTLREAQIVIESWRGHYNTLWTPPAASGMLAWSAVDATIYPACCGGDHALGHDEDPLLSAS
jgi:hypothetical protein